MNFQNLYKNQQKKASKIIQVEKVNQKRFTVNKRYYFYSKHIQSKKSAEMTTQNQVQINEYTLTLLSVKMKVKFPCRMKLQHSGNTITEQVESAEHSKFVFNQEVTIQEPANQQTIDFSIILVTEKGSKYVSGIVKLSTADVEKAQGQKIITPLTKCLDNEAYCELKINKIKIGRIQKRISVSSTLIEMKKLTSDSSLKSPNEEMNLLSPKNKKMNGVETRSEIGFGGLGVRNGHHDWQDTKSKGAAQTLIYRSSFLKSPKDKRATLLNSPKSRLAPDFNQQYQLMSQRQKVSNADSQVYKQGYQKLKQKYKAQTETLNCEQSKRQQLQANENNYKVEIMRLKLKTQEQQRIICQKNEKINQLQVVISEINKQDLDMNFLRQENANLQEKISMMNDTISGLKKDNSNIKKLYEQRQQNDNTLLTELRLQLQSTKQRLQSYSNETSETIRQKTQQIGSLSSELKAKSSQLQLQREEIYKLEAFNQSKIYQFQKTLQEQKNASSQTCNELKQKIQILQRDKKLLQKQISQLKSDKQKIKVLILKAQYDKKVLTQQQKTMKGQIVELKAVKQKHSELTRELALVTQDNTHLRKQLQLQSQSKQVNLQQINEQHELKLNYYKKQAKQFQEKHRLVVSQKIQLQTQVQTGINSIQKQKRQLQSMTNELTSVKTTLKQCKHYASDLQQQRLSLQNQLAITDNKVKFTEHTSRLELDRYKTELERTKLQLQSENLKAVTLFQAKSNLQIQLNKNKIQLQYHEDKIDKLFSSNKQYQATIQYLNKEHDAQTTDLQGEIAQLKQLLKHTHQTVHALELDKINHLQHIQANKKELKLNEEKISHFQNVIKTKSQLIQSWEDRHRQLEKTLNALQNEHSLLKHQHTVLKNQNIKTEKISQLKTNEIQSLKKQLNKTNDQKHQLQQTELNLRDELKKQLQKYVKLQLRLKSLDREHNKFKELMNRTIRTEFAKLPLLLSSTVHGQSQLTKEETQRKAQRQPERSSNTNNNNNRDNNNNNNNNDSKVTVMLNGSARQIQVTPQQVLLQTLSPSFILSSLTTSITDSKTTIFKLIQHNKQLKKQIQSLTQKSQQTSHKYQFTQIQLHRQLQQLQDQLNNIYSQKQQEIVNYDRVVSELNGKLHDKDNLCEEMGQQVEELQYALSSLKLDFENNNNQNDKKVALLKQVMNELQEKIQFFKLSLANQEDANHQLQEKAQLLKTQTHQLTEIVTKNKTLIQDLTKTKQSLQISLQSTVKQRKSLLQQLHSTQLQLNQEKSLKLKANTLLQQQEKKSSELKQFVNTLMKQKENIIKAELQKSDKILQLQTQQIQLKRDLQLSAEQTQRIKSQLQEVKEKLRKQSSTSKNLQLQLTQHKNKLRKVSQKLQEKQKQIQLKDQTIARLDKKYKSLTQKNYKETLQLHSQIDSKYSQNINITKQLNQKILLLEAKIQELQHLTAKQHHQNLLLHDQNIAKEEQLALAKRQHERLDKQLQQAHDQNKSLQNRNSQLTQQIQSKEQTLSHFNQKIIVLQGQLQALNKDKTLKLQQLNIDWTRKYHSLQQEHIHTLSLVQNQREMLRAQLQQKINELELSNSQQLNSQIGINSIKLNYQAKLKSIENDRLNTILTKNNQIKKLTDQNQSLLQNIVELQASLKQSQQLIENFRKRLINEQKLRKDHEQKHKNTAKLHQAQLNTLLAKQGQYKAQKEQLYQMIWTNQRQVRKVVQNYLKKVLDQCDNVHIDKITNSSKGLQAEVVKAMTSKLSPTAA